MTQTGVEVLVNGRRRTAADAYPHTSALEWLRGLGLTAAKEGCAEGECGACAVLVARPDGDGGTRWTAVNSCLVPVLALEGQEVVTAEGLGAPDALHPTQRELATRGGSQCGFCTPGFVCSMAAEYYRTDREPTSNPDAETGPNGFDLHALGGNLCRCTGYRPIREAADALGFPSADDPLAQRRALPAPPTSTGRHSGEQGEYVRPQSLTEALELLAERPDARVVAGATDWGVEVNLRHSRAPVLLALDHLPELRRLTVRDDWIEIGAALSLSDVERGLAGAVPLLAEVFPQFASRLIRNAATLGGNLGTASPIGDAAPALLALDATLVLAARDGERQVPLAEYFTGYRETVLRKGELIRAVRVPQPQPAATMFLKVAKRRFDDISSVAVAIGADFSNGKVSRVRIGLGGVAATPIRATTVEDHLTGRPWDATTVRAAAELMAGEGTPLDDHRASSHYRSAMLRQALLRFHAAHPSGERP
ncbi:xanthine dehydrogenase small subunit [Tessaracoccus rhinocerotis]|uniref:Xanthine dehydrogenase small subunit n=1 Tax=Tessaracoccus rhinocerotis TaxID=1689449 RepID=A0A553K0K9_9ACTN|nr:FAD binding domain-containing protein [Tessaracoccus rhinocerotis]TRY18225.1 xanthine dehydrogenase small subunit [Tessaracoccus rhinocerotis]